MTMNYTDAVYRIGSIFNAAPGQAKQAEVEEWAKANHPEEWAELEQAGLRETDIGMRYSGIDRKIAP